MSDAFKDDEEECEKAMKAHSSYLILKDSPDDDEFIFNNNIK